jgi:hypothetical protein
MRNTTTARTVLTRAILTVTIMSAMSATFTPAFAQTPIRKVPPPPEPAAITRAITNARFEPAIKNRRNVNDPRGMFKDQMRPATRGMWTAVGAVVGAIGAGYLGSYLEGECACDSPGMRGFLVGMPIGGVLGGVIAYRLAR